MSPPLSLGTMQINTGLTLHYGIPGDNLVNIIIIFVITTVFTLAAVMGIEKGIKFIANNNSDQLYSVSSGWQFSAAPL
jgi:glycine betaine transporter